jgi:hypothetical protein
MAGDAGTRFSTFRSRRYSSGSGTGLLGAILTLEPFLDRKVMDQSASYRLND